MAIRIVRNDAGNCINFFGTSNPTYWNACLEGEINEDNANNVNVVNKVRSVEEGTTVYEFFNLPYTLFQDKDENSFESASECAEYITENANVLSDTGTFIFTQTDLLDAQREDTNTTVLFSNGDIYAVNSLQATADSSTGTITIRTIRGSKDIYTKLRYYNVSVNNGAINNFQTIDAAVDRLNEVLSGGTITSDTGTGTADAATSSTSATFTVYGDRITETGSGDTLGYTSTADPGNFDTSNGFYSNELITEPGEFFEFSQDAGNWNGTTGLTFGLFDETAYEVADLDEDVAGNAVKSVLRLRLKNTPFVFKDPDSDLGRLNEVGFSAAANTYENWRVGLDAQNRPYIAAEIDGVWTEVCRTESPAADGTEFRFVAVMPLANVLNGVRNMTVNNIDDAPALTWHYIESPDGVFHYPLFTSAEEANYVDEAYGTASTGNGVSHTETFADQSPTSTIWYMPDTYAFEDESSAPTPPAGVVYNEIATSDDANYVPVSYGTVTQTVDEGDTINLQIKPAGDAASYNVTNVPAGLTYNDVSGFITGTAPAVTGDNVANPSDDYVITVTKSNVFGSSVGTLTLTVNNLDAPATAVTGFTHVAGSTTLVDANTLNDGSAVDVDDILGDGRRFKMTDAYVTSNILPALQGTGDRVYVGIESTSASWGSVSEADFHAGFMFAYATTTAVRVYFVAGGILQNFTNMTIGAASNLGYDWYLDNDGGVIAMLGAPASTKDNELVPSAGGTWPIHDTYDTTVTGDKQIVFACTGTTMDIDTSGLTEYDSPTAPTNMTTWTKALDFSGSNEHLKQVNSAGSVTPITMNGSATTIAAPVTSGYTAPSTSAKPWATAIVFKSDFNSSNQHIWNQGEGAGSVDDNIYLRTDANGLLYFGWGRSGVLNECRLSGQAITGWRGVYIAHKGTRLSGANATAANLADAFDIRILNEVNNWVLPADNLSTSANWITTGGRMDRSVTGDLTIAGRGGNRNFHGKVASMVVTTLRVNQPMPTNAEIEMMVTDPKQWVADYKTGQTFRPSALGGDSSNFQGASHYYHTQVWLMGDGTSDSYANGIRNEVYPADQNYTKLQLNSMVANDFQTVTISGLT
jgi:hypothetical protein